MKNNNSTIAFNVLKVSKIISFTIMILALIGAIGFLFTGSLAALLAIPLFFIAV